MPIYGKPFVPDGSLLQVLTRQGYITFNLNDDGLRLDITDYTQGKPVSAGMTVPMEDVTEIVDLIRHRIRWDYEDPHG